MESKKEDKLKKEHYFGFQKASQKKKLIIFFFNFPSFSGPGKTLLT